MKINIIITAITVIVLTVLSATGFFIYKTLTKPEARANKSPVVIGEGNPSTSSSTDGKEVLKETRLLKKEFEITLPPGWQESTTTNSGFLLLAFDANEDTSGGNFQKLDFRTNLSIKGDDMKAYSKVTDLGAYVESVKTSLMQVIPGIKFTKEEQKKINGGQAIFIEAESRQEEADFRTLLVFLEGNDRAVYALSFNTFQSSWANYRDVFYRVSESFKLKYQINL